MEQKTTQWLQERLDQKKRKAGTRFRIDNFSQETVEEMLQMCYKAEVEQRDMIYKGDPDTLSNIRKVSKWLCTGKRFGLLLYGSIGSGKTTLARSVCTLIGLLYGTDYRLQERIGVVKISALDMAARVTADAEYLSKLKKYDLLFIDDLGVEPETVKSWGNEISPITELLYYRYDNRLFTMATSNLGDEDFRVRYGNRIYDRMEEMFDRLYYTHDSYRK